MRSLRGRLAGAGIPRTLALGALLAVASWLILALWPPASARPLAGAAIAAALTVGVLARRRPFVWLLLLFVAVKMSGDAYEYTQRFYLVPTVMVTTDVVAFVLLALPGSRRWARRMPPTLQDEFGDETPSSGEHEREFEFAWTPTVAEYERVMRAVRWVERRIALRWAVAGTLAFLLAFAVGGGDPTPIALLCVAVVWTSGVGHYVGRRFFVARRRPLMLQPVTVCVTPETVVSSTEHMTVESEWVRWPVCLVLTDMVVLMTAKSGRNVVVLPIVRRGLAGGERWNDFVRLVLSKVRPHPRADRLLGKLPF